MRRYFFFILVLFTLPAFTFAAQSYDPNFGPERAAVTQQPKTQVDSFDGSFTYQYPFNLPPGRNGLEPNLSLTYSSKDTEQISPFGYGWSANIPYIERINEQGVNNLYLTNNFFSSFDGELQSTSSQSYTEFGALADNGDFRKYEFVSRSYWVVTDKKGTRYTFGTSTLSQLVNTASTTEVYRWMLEKIQDRNGNYITYEYYKDGNQIYPSKIKYTGNGTADGIYVIEFARENRTDIATSTKTGFEVVSRYRIKEVYAKENGTLIKSYKLGFSPGDNGQRSLLTSFLEAGRSEAGATTTMATTSLTYSIPAKGWTASSTWVMPEYFIDDTGTSPSAGDMGVRFEDFNGDGLVDVLKARDDAFTDTIYINKGDGTWSTTTPSGIKVMVSAQAEGSNSLGTDIDGDGLSDFVTGWASSTINTNRGSSFVTDANWYADTTFLATTSGIFYDAGGRVVDLNGDGLADLAKSYASTTSTQLEAENGIYLNNGAGWDTAVSPISLTENLVSHWKLDESSGTAIDVHGDNDLTNVNTVTYATSKINNGADFEKSSTHYLQITDANQTGLDLTTNMSTCFWLKPESNPAYIGPSDDGWWQLVSKDASSNRAFNFYYLPNGGTYTLAFYAFNPSSSAYTRVWADQNLGTGTFHHICATWNGAGSGATGKIKIYVDGSQVTATDSGEVGGGITTMSNGTAPFIVGGDPTNSRYYVDGIMDEFGIWSNTLAPSQVLELYNSGTGKSYTQFASSTQSWRLPSNKAFAGTDAISDPPAGTDQGARFADFNADGLTDIFYSRAYGTPTSYNYIYFNDGDGTWTQTIPGGDLATSTAFVNSTGQDNGYRLADVNADGLTDIINTTGASGYTVYINKDGGRTFATSSAWGTIPLPFICDNDVSGCSSSSDDAGGRFVDINGDGVTDVVRADAINAHGTAVNSTYIGNATTPADLLVGISSSQIGSTTVGYKSAAEYVDSGGNELNPRLPINFQTVETITTNSRASQGIISTTTYTYAGGEYYYASEFDRKFAGFATTTVTDPLGNVTKTYLHQGNGSQTSIGEYNDSRTKIGKPYRVEVYNSTNNLYTKKMTKWEDVSLSNGRNFVLKTRELEMNYDGDSDHKDKGTTYEYDNTNGNLTAVTEYGEVTGSDDGSFQAGTVTNNTRSIDFEKDSSQRASIADASQAGLDFTSNFSISLWAKAETLSSINRLVNKFDSSGGTDAGYALRMGSSPATGLCADLSSNGSTVNSYCVTWSASASTWYNIAMTFNASAKELKFYVNGSQQGATVSTTEGSIYNNAAAFCVAGMQASCSDTFNHDGLIDDVAVWSRELSGSEVSSIYNSGGGRSYTNMSSSLKTNMQGYWGFENNYSDSTTNGNTLTGSGSPTFSTDVGFTDYSNYEYDRKSVYTYAASTTTHVIGFLKNETILNGAAATTSERRLYYDTLALGSVDKGNLTKEERLATSTSYLDTEWTYDSYGLPITIEDARGKTTTLSYNSNLFVATSTNAAGHVTEFYRDMSSGKAKKTVDPNGLVFETVYDGLDRPTEEKIPDHLGTPSNTVTVRTYEYNDTEDYRWIKQTNYLNNATSTERYTYIDGFGRKLQERTEAESSYAVKDWEYDARGQVKKESLPYFDTGSARTSITSNSALLVNYVYDPLGRLATTTDAIGTTKASYNQWTETTTDKNGEIKDYGYDAFRNLVQVVEHTSTTTATTTYAYDALNNLATTTDALGNIRLFTYDGLSRLLSAEDLHAVGDTNYGKRFYNYDAAGNLASTTDAKGQTIVYTHDDLNRVLTENYTGVSGTEVQYAYDTCTYGKGRLCFATTTEAVTKIEYNALGDAATSTKIINNATSTTTFTHDRQKNITKINYPNGISANYIYNSAGFFEQLWLQTAPGVITYIATSTEYGPTGQATVRELGNGINTVYNYDSNALYRLTNILSGPGTVTFATTSTTTMPTNLVSWWEFNNSANDSHTSANHLTTTGSPAYATGKQNNGIDLEKDSTQYASIADASQTGLDIATNMSVCMWLKPESNPNPSDPDGGWWVLANKDVWDSRAWELYYLPDAGTYKLAFYAFNGNSTHTHIYITNDLGTGTFHYVCATWDGSQSGASNKIKIYVDGTAQTVVSSNDGGVTSIPNSSAPFKMGADNLAARYYVDGVVDELAVWSRTLNSTDISTLYNAGVGKAYLTVSTSTASTTGARIQDLSYTYDTAGNIITLTDYSGGGTGKAITFAYDDLHRLTSASTTAASSTPYNQTYSYSATGNISNKSDVGIYLYGTSTYANPHAAISVNGVTYTYDNNGNLTQIGSGFGSTAYTWDWRDRLTQTATGTATTTYAYDYDNSRIRRTVIGQATTTYPNQYYNYSTTGSTTAHIFLPDGTSIATVETNGISTSTYWLHLDHLGSVHAITNSAGTTINATDYYPYGSQRIASSSTAYTEQRGYIGQNYDPDSSMSYLNARYYRNTQGQFFSEDPVFKAMGNPQQIKQITGLDMKVVLADPQLQNSYSYARGNPILLKDPQGNLIPLAGFLAIPAAGSILSLIGYGFTGLAVIRTTESAYNNIVLPIQYPAAFTPDQRTQGYYNFAGDAFLNLSSLAVPSEVKRTAIDVLFLGAEQMEYDPKKAKRDGKDAAQWLYDAVNKEKVSSSAISNGSGSGNGNPYQGQKISSGGSQTVNSGNGAGASNMVYTPGLLPRSKDPVGQSGGQPIYCWGQCGK